MVSQEEAEVKTKVNEMEERKFEKRKMEAGKALVNKVGKLDAILASELNSWKQDMEESNAPLQKNITEIQASLKLCEEQKKSPELERDSWKQW